MDIRSSYREAAVRGSSPLELVVRLYEQIIEDLRQARQAFEQNNVELRTDRINHVILILGLLQSQLDFDAGGKVAENLDHFYNVVRQTLMYVQFHPSARGLEQLITDVLAVREAWIEVARAEAPSVKALPSMHPPAAATESDLVRLDWKG